MSILFGIQSAVYILWKADKLTPGSQKNTFPLHPFLIAAYPVFSLLANNIEEVKAIVALRPLVICLLISVLLFIILRLLLKNSAKAGLVTTIVLIFFFSYGHIYSFFEQNSQLLINLGRHRILAPIWAVVLITLLVLSIRTTRDLRPATHFLNIITAFALLMPILQIGIFEMRTLTSSKSDMDHNKELTGISLPQDRPTPDVYYIILDAYARDDYLLQDQGYNNSTFLRELENLGFFIANCSQSNYAQTQLSLASSLNMNYLQGLGGQFNPNNTSRVGVDELIRHGVVRQAFESMGYSTAAFETGFKYTQWEDAGLYLSPTAGTLENLQIAQGLNEFEAILIKTTAGLILADSRAVVPRILQPDLDNPRRIHRERILFALDQLGKLPDLPGPKFVFAHLIIPHPPYVFGSDGEFTDFDIEAKTGYLDQIDYINKRMVPLLQDIISSSATPPIIIIQGDHGAIHSPPDKRLEILNAVYLPEISPEILYEQMTPVNTFRIILNKFFGGSYPLLTDTGYYSSYKTPYDFSVIPNSGSACR